METLTYPQQNTLFGLNNTKAAKIIITFIMLNNILHAAELYHFTTNGVWLRNTWELFTTFTGWQSLLSVAGIDVGLLVLINFSLEKSDLRTAKAFAWLLFLINLFFWRVIHDLYAWQHTFTDPDKLTGFLSKIMFSAFFSYSIHKFCHLHIRWAGQNQQESHLKQALTEIEASVTKTEASAEQLLTKLHQLESEQSQLANQFQSHQDQNQAEADLQRKLDQAIRERDHYQALVKREQVKRTLYLADGKEEEFANVPQLNGKMNGLPEEAKQYHQQTQKKHLEALEKRLVK